MRRVLVLAGVAGERLRQSLFFIPALFVLGAVLLAQLMLEVDARVGPDGVPTYVRTTLDSARALVAAIAGGTITATALVVSLTLVAVQVASSQFSPRSLRRFIGDRFQQVMLGLLVGTFAYCLWVLRAMRAPLPEGGDPVIPSVSVLVAALAAIVALLAVLASIDHTARSLRVEAVARAIEQETTAVIGSRFGDRSDHATGAGTPGNDQPASPDSADPAEPVMGTTAEVGAPRGGWVQQIDDRALAESVPRGSTVYVETAVGSFVLEGEVVVRIRARDQLGEEALDRTAQGLAIGDERTMQQDVAYGITRLVDIALRALSPGVSDPHTAEEVIARLGSVLLRLFEVPLGTVGADVEGRRLVRHHEPTHDAYVDLACTAIRRHAAQEPGVLAVLRDMLGRLEHEVERRGLPGGTHGLRQQRRAVERGLLLAEANERARWPRGAGA